MTTKDWLSLLVTLIGVFAGPALAVRWSIKQFQSQKWWELKAEVYSNIMGQLSAVRQALDLWIDLAESRRGASAEQKKLVSKEYSDAKHALGKTAAAGAFIISDEASKALSRLVSQLNLGGGRGDWLEQLGDDYTAVNDCIAQVREYAKTDLRRRGALASAASLFKRTVSRLRPKP